MSSSLTETCEVAMIRIGLRPARRKIVPKLQTSPLRYDLAYSNFERDNCRLS